MTIFVVAIGSLGIAGIPGTATMAASVGLSGVGMGAQFGMVSPILAIDPIIDMPRTMINVTGSLTKNWLRNLALMQTNWRRLWMTTMI